MGKYSITKRALPKYALRYTGEPNDRITDQLIKALAGKWHMRPQPDKLGRSGWMYGYLNLQTVGEVQSVHAFFKQRNFQRMAGSLAPPAYGHTMTAYRAKAVLQGLPCYVYKVIPIKTQTDTQGSSATGKWVKATGSAIHPKRGLIRVLDQITDLEGDGYRLVPQGQQWISPQYEPELMTQVLTEAIRLAFPYPQHWRKGATVVCATRECVRLTPTRAVYHGISFGVRVFRDGTVLLLTDVEDMLVDPVSVADRLREGRCDEIAERVTLLDVARARHWTISSLDTEGCPLHRGSGKLVPIPNLKDCHLTFDLADAERSDPGLASRVQQAIRRNSTTRQCFQRSQQFVGKLNKAVNDHLKFAPDPVRAEGGFRSDVIRGDNLAFGGDFRHSQQDIGLGHAGFYAVPPPFNFVCLAPPEVGRTETTEKARDVVSHLRRKARVEVSDLGVLIYQRTPDDAVLVEKLTRSSDRRIAALVLLMGHRDKNEPRQLFRALRSRRDDVWFHPAQVENIDQPEVRVNLAVQLGAEMGGVPWQLVEMPGMEDNDVFLAVDLGHRRWKRRSKVASALFNSLGEEVERWIEKDVDLNEQVRADLVKQLVDELLAGYKHKHGQLPRSVVLHRDGRFLEDWQLYQSALADQGITAADFVEVIKSGTPRIGALIPGSRLPSDPERGTVIFYCDYAWLVTTTQSLRLGGMAPSPILVRKIAGNRSIEELTQQVYWLAQVYDRSAFFGSSVPSTISTVDRAARVARSSR